MRSPQASGKSLAQSAERIMAAKSTWISRLVRVVGSTRLMVRSANSGKGRGKAERAEPNELILESPGLRFQRAPKNSDKVYRSVSLVPRPTQPDSFCQPGRM